MAAEREREMMMRMRLIKVEAVVANDGKLCVRQHDNLLHDKIIKHIY